MPKNLGLYNNTLSVPRKKDIDAVQDTVDMHDSDIQQLESDVNGLNTEISAVKTALTSKQDKITGAGSTITDDNLTANRALISNASGKVDVSDITTTQLDYLKNPVTSVNGQTGEVTLDLTKFLELAGGTMLGTLVAQSNANYTTPQARNVIISANLPTSEVGNNGDIWIRYRT